MTRVAVHQLAPVVGDLEGNRARTVAAIDAAAAALPILAVGVTAYDPAADEARRGPEIAARLLGHVAAAARG